ncbi:acyl-CoA desaturase [Fulvivirga sp. M361]|uniref:fatty acid desaturase family protein n=1 Tax=Fulvivirga sp. M361 TaxID=2594266 RepID=UPI00117B5EDE|nr:acyl-CoA desaturase [Fulvivirga sp. M361]TRX59385.1 acyl-CoA desaturase [Fulvivirga sp. M361]
MKIKFNGKNRPGFYVEVKKRVDEYFKSRNISKNANGEMVFKTVLFLGLLVALYILIIWGGFSLPVTFALTIAIGMVQAFIGFNVCHDAIHGSYSSNGYVNKYLSYVFNLIGANAYVWKITHNMVHHTYTNIPGHDEDLDVAPGLVRLSKLEEMKPIMKYQHIYAFFLYGLASLSWVFRKDYVKFFSPKIGHTENTNHPRGEYFNLFFFKTVYYTLFIVVPLLVMDITWWQFIIGFIFMHLAEGLVLGLVFQLAHTVEGIDFPEPDEKGFVEESWAVHQMHTTANFARKSWLASFLCGGLNFQVEHHLFANICHVHYPAISKIVEEVATEHGVPYHENKTFYGALVSHYKTLKRFGKDKEPDLQPA